ncbi:hypothetical protein GWI33_008550 [Rhynchophorus ferrugineus]|uniref:Uncharacterized protein n=1 Tax=Rhynchophorus ferrugineus TaxID=354439 RepID=A0A834II04_RHYFE|nr:hypothetical protein GWI33_008550 [Rhynchophorus ferrugineus]
MPTHHASNGEGYFDLSSEKPPVFQPFHSLWYLFLPLHLVRRSATVVFRIETLRKGTEEQRQVYERRESDINGMISE